MSYNPIHPIIQIHFEGYFAYFFLKYYKIKKGQIFLSHSVLNGGVWNGIPAYKNYGRAPLPAGTKPNVILYKV